MPRGAIQDRTESGSTTVELQTAQWGGAEAIAAGIGGCHQAGAGFGAHSDQLLSLGRGQGRQVSDDHPYALLAERLKKYLPAWPGGKVIDDHAQLGLVEGADQLLELAAEVVLSMQPAEGRPGAALLQRVLTHDVDDDRAERLGIRHGYHAEWRTVQRIA